MNLLAPLPSNLDMPPGKPTPHAVKGYGVLYIAALLSGVQKLSLARASGSKSVAHESRHVVAGLPSTPLARKKLLKEVFQRFGIYRTRNPTPSNNKQVPAIFCVQKGAFCAGALLI